jgi:hypothetical protein
MESAISKPDEASLGMKFSLEHQLLLCCARLHLTATDQERLRELAGASLNWDELLRETRRQCIVPLLYRHLQSVCADLVSSKILGQLREEYISAAARSMSLAAELCAITRLLEEGGVDPLPYKGPVLALQAYGDIALRTFTDLDVLVRKSDVAKAREILLTRGYSSLYELSPAQDRAMLRLEHNLPLVDPTGDFLVELHWRVAPTAFTFPISMDGLWDRATQIPMGATAVRAMSVEDLLIILPVHGTRHAWSAVEWITGIAELIRRTPCIEWNRVMQRADQLQVGRIVRLGMALANRLLGAPIPEQVAQWVKADRRIARLVGWVAARLFTPHDSETAAEQWEVFQFELAVKDRTRQRVLDGLRRLVHPSLKDWQAVRIPDALFPLYFLIRPGRLLARQLRNIVWRRAKAQ